MTYAERIVTEWGWTVPLTLRTEEDHNLRIFTPISYEEVFTDTVINEINNSVKDYNRIFRGKWTITMFYI